MNWEFSYDEYYIEMEKDFEKYKNVEEELAIYVAKHIKKR